MVKLTEIKLISFLLEVKAEMERVVWPSRREIVKLTLIVIGVSVATGFFLGSLDFFLTKLTEFFLKR
ncbi:preprotein translocase subunit SecE [Candidatus Curtissbacteria bacterium RBG_16_39_7]|uniref:Protein translocase subunit SecE n=1 Tax=Candidatus Curtissbacteria bacterium RBG_16_39_7 TaxID=1797707 RepID=A0A1F5G284_9BACT|nr:MAG: preprotein translocase subunit SecE [Candidatus Curtissbacteria bacterium RBG_16_39_7]